MTGKALLRSIFTGFILFMIPLASHAETDGPLDLRLSADLGLFLYDQTVEGGGYYIDGRGYDLLWYGLQAQLIGEIEYRISPRLSIGGGGSFFIAIQPTAMDQSMTVSVYTGENAYSGFGGLCGSYWTDNHSRINLMAGYGGTGIPSYYGGYGPVFSVFWSQLYAGPGSILKGLGMRFTYMYLHYEGTASVRGETGGYLTLLLEASIDWIPRFR